MQAETLAKIEAIESSLELLRKHVNFDDAQDRLVALEAQTTAFDFSVISFSSLRLSARTFTDFLWFPARLWAIRKYACIHAKSPECRLQPVAQCGCKRSHAKAGHLISAPHRRNSLDSVLHHASTTPRTTHSLRVVRAESIQYLWLRVERRHCR